MPPAAPTAPRGTMEIPPISVGRARLTVRGISPLIVHRFAEKAKKEMADKQQGRARAARQPKNPNEEFIDSLYIVAKHDKTVRAALKNPDKIGAIPEGAFFMPGLCFKAALVGAARFADAKMTEVRGALFVSSEPTLKYGALSMREDTVRLGGTTSDLRYRGQFDDWFTDLEVEYNTGCISLEEVVNLLNIAGFSQGVGEWRPSSKSGGEFGRYTVEAVEEL